MSPPVNEKPSFRSVVEELDNMLEGGDKEVLHARADQLVLDYLKGCNWGGAKIVEAYLRARDRVGFRYA